MNFRRIIEDIPKEQQIVSSFEVWKGFLFEKDSITPSAFYLSTHSHSPEKYSFILCQNWTRTASCL